MGVCGAGREGGGGFKGENTGVEVVHDIGEGVEKEGEMDRRWVMLVCWEKCYFFVCTYLLPLIFSWSHTLQGHLVYSGATNLEIS